MSATTPARGIPYPTGTDSLADALELVVKQLAERVDLLLPQVGSTGTLTVGATATDYYLPVSFPRAYEAGVVPSVCATADTANATVGVAVDNVTNTGFRLVYRRLSGSANIGNVRWIAARA